SVVMSLAAGNERHFFFVLPDYLENGIQFGALRPDLTPHPAFLALSAAANVLGEGDYLGRLPVAGAEAHLFRTPRGRVLVAWADHETELAVPVDGAAARVADVFGATRYVGARGGGVRLTAGPDAVYVLNAGKAAERGLTGRTAVPPPRRARPAPSPVVVAPRAELPFNKDANAYRLAGPFDYAVEAVNLGAETARGTVELALPAGWSATPARFPFALAALGREEFRARVTLGARSLDTRRIGAGAGGATVFSDFQEDDAAWRVAAEAPLPWGDPTRWSPAAGNAAPLEILPAGTSGMRLRVERRSATGEGWYEAECRLDLPTDLTGFDAVLCTLRSHRQEG
ncbi:MAG: hypothetical protein AAB368_17040, partial [bacterium]